MHLSRTNTFHGVLLLLFGLHVSASSSYGQEDEGSGTKLRPVRQSSRILRGGDHGVGQMVPDVFFTDIDGVEHSLGQLAQERTLVIAMTSTSCPLSGKYLPTLVELAKASGSDVAWLVVDSIATDEPKEINAAASQFGERALYVHDRDGRVAQHIGALSTTDVIVIDRSRTVVYHGAIDDQYGFGYSLDAPRHRYLADALAAIERGHQPEVSATEALGCSLAGSRTESSTESSDVTYHNRISRIVQQHCIECHRDGGVAPFALETYQEVAAHAAMIEQVVQDGIMPPWFAGDAAANLDTTKPKHSPWANDRSLSVTEKRNLLDWIAGDKPPGDQRDSPVPRRFEDDWLIGKPDAVFQFEEPVSVQATGFMPYKNIVVETDLPEDRWVQAIEVKPGNRAVVHHVLVFAIGAGGESQDERDGYWGIYVPGNSTLVYPNGFAKRLPKHAKLRFQMHYTPNGTATTDQTSIGVIFAKSDPIHEVRVAGISNAKISIPPGASNHREESTLRVPSDSDVLGFLPHMHLRGKACRFEVTTPAGVTETLLDIPRYDFNWQLLYRYHQPLSLHAGDTLKFTAWYDNSSDNPANPDPTKTVRWGPQTHDEMQLGYVEYFVPTETPRLSGSDTRSQVKRDDRSKRNERLFLQLDGDKDGQITKAEVRERMPNDPQAAGSTFDRIDTDNDGYVTRSEFEKL